jgi:hypothetical protein
MNINPKKNNDIKKRLNFTIKISPIIECLKLHTADFILLTAFFSKRETCACDIPISFATSICVLP